MTLMLPVTRQTPQRFRDVDPPYPFGVPSLTEKGTDLARTVGGR
jgi:hypothetical protein